MSLFTCRIRQSGGLWSISQSVQTIKRVAGTESAIYTIFLKNQSGWWGETWNILRVCQWRLSNYRILFKVRFVLMSKIASFVVLFSISRRVDECNVKKLFLKKKVLFFFKVGINLISRFYSFISEEEQKCEVFSQVQDFHYSNLINTALRCTSDKRLYLPADVHQRHQTKLQTSRCKNETSQWMFARHTSTHTLVCCGKSAAVNL